MNSFLLGIFELLEEFANPDNTTKRWRSSVIGGLFFFGYDLYWNYSFAVVFLLYVVTVPFAFIVLEWLSMYVSIEETELPSEVVRPAVLALSLICGVSWWWFFIRDIDHSLVAELFAILLLLPSVVFLIWCSFYLAMFLIGILAAVFYVFTCLMFGFLMFGAELVRKSRRRFDGHD